MKNTKMTISRLAFAAGLISAFTFTSCDSDDGSDADDTSASTGTANVAVTDAAVDAENVSNVYLNVTGLKFDSDDDASDTVITFESTRQFDLMAYQNGDVYDLESVEVNAASYKSLTLVLDEDGGAYVQYTDNSTAEIVIDGDSTNEYVISSDFDIDASAQTDLIVDIDLRKNLEASEDGTYVLKSSSRVVKAESTGTISGTIDNYTLIDTVMASFNEDFKVVAMAFKDGEFTSGDGEANLENSVSTAVVADDGTFSFSYISESDYDIAFAVYAKDADAAADVALEFYSFINTKLSSASSFGTVLDGISVTASSETTIDLSVNMDD